MARRAKVTRDTNLFYNEIARPFIDAITDDIVCTYFDIRNYETILRNENKEDDKNLIALQKLLSPNHLLKVPFANDSNSLNDKFYKELLHIIGLEEVKEGSKNIIRRKITNRHSGSLLENTINILETEDSLRRMKDRASYGETREDQLFSIALELCLTWINRVLFLKLLEGQLITYHKGDPGYRFLNAATIVDFDELYKLFHQVLARNVSERSPNIQQKYSRVPYLNSSLFEISELEAAALKINSLDDSETLELLSTTILKDERKKNTSLPTLHYLFKFLDAYDFASEGGEDIAEDNKTIINASVLGKVFEKINGYKDGSIFTPGFITMYMSRQSLRPAVIQKFNEYFKTEGIAEISTFEELYNRVDKIEIKTANQVVNSLRVCDPAVGSGHFLVSALNELILIKSELGILADKNGKRLRDYEFTIENDELIITDEHGLFVYNHLNKESQRVQETIFGERQTIIENCLFGVDINPNSVKICRLRLWIELLKSSYYLPSPAGEPGVRLETLPNIDINIKCGNSLISRYALDADIKKALKRSKWSIDSYRLAIMSYRNARSKEEKRDLEDLILAIKSDFETEVSTSDKRFIRLKEGKGRTLYPDQPGAVIRKIEKVAEWNRKVAENSGCNYETGKGNEEIKKQRYL
ncbi:MAG: DNA methyltransferase [Bacteroidales bacterium]